MWRSDPDPHMDGAHHKLWRKGGQKADRNRDQKRDGKTVTSVAFPRALKSNHY